MGCGNGMCNTEMLPHLINMQTCSNSCYRPTNQLSAPWEIPAKMVRRNSAAFSMVLLSSACVLCMPFCAFLCCACGHGCAQPGQEHLPSIDPFLTPPQVLHRSAAFVGAQSGALGDFCICLGNNGKYLMMLLSIGLVLLHRFLAPPMTNHPLSSSELPERHLEDKEFVLSWRVFMS